MDCTICKAAECEGLVILQLDSESRSMHRGVCARCGRALRLLLRTPDMLLDAIRLVSEERVRITVKTRRELGAAFDSGNATSQTAAYLDFMRKYGLGSEALRAALGGGRGNDEEPRGDEGSDRVDGLGSEGDGPQRRLCEDHAEGEEMNLEGMKGSAIGPNHLGRTESRTDPEPSRQNRTSE